MSGHKKALFFMPALTRRLLKSPSVGARPTRRLPWRMQAPLSQCLYEQHQFSLDMSLFGPRG